MEHQSISDNQPPLAIFPEIPPSMGITCTSGFAEYNYYGVLKDDVLLKEATDFIIENSDGESSRVTPVLHEFLTRTRDDCIGTADDKSAAWFTIRVSGPMDEYRIPRWHQDGKMFRPDREGLVRSKYVMTVLGNSTRVLVNTPHLFEVIKRSENLHGMREAYAAKLKDHPSEDIKPGQIIRFSWGRDDSPVHSEPDMSTDRIFISIMYASKTEMQRMAEFRGEDLRK